MFFCEFCEMFKNTFPNRTPPVAASDQREKRDNYKVRRKVLKRRKIKTVDAVEGFHHKFGSFHQGKRICFFEKCTNFLFLLVQFPQ